MSDLLQQAIIDATALKEAAIKNAENTLIEKYSEEFNETVKKLLEQEEAAASATSTASPTPDAAAASSVAPAAADSQTDLGGDQSDKRDAFKTVKTAFLDGPEDELITINFDQLKSTMMEMLGYEQELEEEYDRTGTRSEDVAKDSLKAGAKKKNKTLQEESDEDSGDEESVEEGASYNEDEAIESLQEMEVQLDEFEDPATAGAQELSDAAKLKKQAAEKESQAASKKNAASAEKAKAEKDSSTVQTEDIQLTEEELLTLEEDYRVDLDPEHQNRGYMGSTNSERELLRQLEMAAARDEHNTKQREEEKKKMQDLVKENTKLKDLNDKMLSALETLKEQVEKINVSNAKLLYTNKALANISLNERQKNQIVESISKADSVLAARTIYETIQNAVEGAQTKTEAPQSLRETLNRASTPFVVKKSSSNSIADTMSERMKILAGIKKQ